jgi:hypothetical protein
MSEHTRAQELAATALDFELTPDEREELERHLTACAACRAVQTDLDTIQRVMADLPAEDAPAELRRRILHPDTAPTRSHSPSRWALPARFRWPAVGLATAAAAVVVAVVATTLPWQASHAPNVAVVSPSAPSPASPGPDATNGPIATDRPPILAYAPRAELTAGSATGPVVAPDSDFRLASLDSTPAAELAARISVEPSLDLVVEHGSDAGTVRLRPAAPLQPGVLYRFTLVGANGQPEDTWAFQARQSVRVVATTPEDTQTDVPLDTGIEITFDQDGVVDPASHLKIQPSTAGRFEQRGRTLAFIPDRLKAATLYTVTVTRGVKVAGTDETLAEDYRFRFETAAKAGATTTTFGFPDDLLEVPTAGRPDLPLFAFTEDDVPPVASPIEVYRFVDVQAAIEGYRQLRRSARWARWSIDDAVPTVGMRRVLSFRAALQRGGESLWFRLPEPLAPGWYLVQRPSTGRPAQLILQVTDVASYLTVSDSRTLVWANDLDGGRPLAGATATLDGTELGRTDTDGLLLVDTPAQLRRDSAPGCTTDACLPVVLVRTADGRSMFMPADNPYGQIDVMSGGGYGSLGQSEDYWLVHHTDRLVYRRTDTINVWGVIRDRATGAVPETVDVQLVTGLSDPMPPPIASMRVRPGPTGAFTGSLPIADLPEGTYDVILRDGGAVVGSTGIQVARILKPAYRLEVETGRRVYFQGDRIRITSRASFYEGSPVPGVALRIDGRVQRNVKTDATGTAVYRTVARVDPDLEDAGWDYQSISVSPARAEEGEVTAASREFLVFPSSQTINGEATNQGGRVRVSGTVHLVDRDRLEAELGAGLSPWEIDPRGRPVARATVTLTFIEQIPVRTRIGTEYDWIEKKAVPVYETTVQTREVRTMRVRTAGDGSFSSSVADSGRDHDYQVRMTVGDPDGHTARQSAYATGGGAASDEIGFEGAVLVPTTPAAEPSDGYAIGDRIDLTVRETRPVSAGWYLFEVAQRGLREATIQRSPRLVTRFESWAVPNVAINAVHFTGTRYVQSEEYHPSFRASERAVEVGLTTARPRYAPGDEVTLDVRTRDHDGQPVAASVILQAIDAKLFTIGAAADADPLHELYTSISSGVRTRFASHRTQRQRPGEGGDTTGGGGEDRVDFRDALLFKIVTTGEDGRARTTFRLSDDLTSWRVSGAAVTADLEAGITSIEVPVGLPFFVDASIAPEYLSGDRPSIQVRAYGAALEAGADVRITVASHSLGLAQTTLRAKAFATVSVPLPRLSPGVHTVTISAVTGTGASEARDQLTRSFSVVASRLERTRTAYVDGNAAGSIPGGAGLTNVVISDASAGRYLPLLLDIAGGEGARLERTLGAAMASSLLAGRYGMHGGLREPVDFDGSHYQSDAGGIAPLPYSSSDLDLTSLVAIVAQREFSAAGLRDYLETVRDAPRSTREQRVFALAGLAGLGVPVLPQIQTAAADARLTIREQLMVGLGAAAIGDATTARTIAARLWAAHGERLGGEARLRVGDSTADITDATARMAVLAAAVGDPLAPALWAYVAENPSTDVPFELLAVAFVDRLIERLPVEPASFAYVVDGKRTVIELETGETFQLTLTAAQRASLRLEVIEGTIGLATSWREPVAASTLVRDPDVTISRARTPAAVVGTADLVRVDLTVRFGPKAPAACHQVTELVPSGLIPIGPNLHVEEDGNVPAGITEPFAVVGQRVLFCAEPTKKQRTVRLRYYARVITPGTYVWEQAVVESRTAPDRAASTPRATIRIR